MREIIVMNVDAGQFCPALDIKLTRLKDEGKEYHNRTHLDPGAAVTKQHRIKDAQLVIPALYQDAVIRSEAP